jgi:prophage DNA circulation protein
VFNLVGEISKILFGKMDDHDVNYYADKVSQLEREQLDFLKITREQISVVKATLRSVNSTLSTVLENEKILSKGLEGMMNHVNEQDGEIKEMFTILSLMLTINEHAVHLNRAIEECRREYQILIDPVIDAQRGVFEPQLITPAQILEQIKNSQPDMPNDMSLPFPRSATYLSVLLRIVNIDVFFKGKFLVYIIRVPLDNQYGF